MKTAKLTIQVLQSDEDTKNYAQDHRGGLMLDVGDVVVSLCMDGKECGSKVFQVFEVIGDNKEVVHKAAGMELAAAYIDLNCFSELESK